MSDRYDDLKGPELAAELSERALSVTGRVDELRDRLREDDEKRAQAAADGPDGGPTDSDPTEDGPEVPEPRSPVDWTVQTLALTEDQARELTRREAKLRAVSKHVNPTTPRKYVAGDRVAAILDGHTAQVLPFGIEIELSEGQN